MTLQDTILKHLANLKREASRSAIHKKLDRLAELNIRFCGGRALGKVGILTIEEEVERQFLSMTLPHAARRGEFEKLLEKLVP